MDAWRENPGLPPELPSTRDEVSDATRSPPPGGPKNLSLAPAPRTTKPASSSDAEDVSGISLPRTAAVEANAGPERVSVEARFRPSCTRNHLVLARLFKMHPDFDAAIEGILAGDTGRRVDPSGVDQAPGSAYLRRYLCLRFELFVAGKKAGEGVL